MLSFLFIFLCGALLTEVNGDYKDWFNRKTDVDVKFWFDFGILPLEVREYIDKHPGYYNIHPKPLDLPDSIWLGASLDLKKGPTKDEHFIVENTIEKFDVKKLDLSKIVRLELELYDVDSDEMIYYTNTFHLVDIIVPKKGLATVHFKNLNALNTFAEDKPTMWVKGFRQSGKA